MLSTDKAVNPTSLMGASKKIAEMYIEAIAKTNGTQFMAVRFGNVLGSEGSVIPTFRKQIERGGPIEITHPEIKRYFMTIPEAAGLVLEAGVSGKGGEIFILEMGQQIKIVDLAEDLVRLSGKILGKDIEIKYVGLRPGEKMYEELYSNNEVVELTSHNKIMIVKQKKDNACNVFDEMVELEKIVENGEMHQLRQKLKQLIPSYTFTENSNGDQTSTLKNNAHSVLLQENSNPPLVTH
jgi:FlaA1/EpsC-like NDP-sugar epimerase